IRLPVDAHALESEDPADLRSIVALHSDVASFRKRIRALRLAAGEHAIDAVPGGECVDRRRIVPTRLRGEDLDPRPALRAANVGGEARVVPIEIVEILLVAPEAAWNVLVDFVTAGRRHAQVAEKEMVDLAVSRRQGPLIVVDPLQDRLIVLAVSAKRRIKPLVQDGQKVRESV